MRALVGGMGVFILAGCRGERVEPSSLLSRRLDSLEIRVERLERAAAADSARRSASQAAADSAALGATRRPR